MSFGKDTDLPAEMVSLGRKGAGLFGVVVGALPVALALGPGALTVGGGDGGGSAARAAKETPATSIVAANMIAGQERLVFRNVHITYDPEADIVARFFGIVAIA